MPTVWLNGVVLAIDGQSVYKGANPLSQQPAEIFLYLLQNKNVLVTMEELLSNCHQTRNRHTGDRSRVSKKPVNKNNTMSKAIQRLRESLGTGKECLNWENGYRLTVKEASQAIYHAVSAGDDDDIRYLYATYKDNDGWISPVKDPMRYQETLLWIELLRRAAGALPERDDEIIRKVEQLESDVLIPERKNLRKAASEAKAGDQENLLLDIAREKANLALFLARLYSAKARRLEREPAELALRMARYRLEPYAEVMPCQWTQDERTEAREILARQ